MRALSLSRSWRLGWSLGQPSCQCRNVAVGARKHRLAFLGTPQVATIPLKGLLEAASKDENADFEVVAVVSQPPRARGRGKKPPQPSPVHQAALEANIPESAILTPVKANDAEFLSTLAALEPDLCVTAAYGNMLPQKLLDMPKFGTLNIHPSLLPKYRGAAPVNRCLENGDMVTGVSVAYTVLKCDAGPVLAQQELQLQGDEQAPELLDTLFAMGTDLLIEKLPEVWSGAAEAAAVAQDETCMTHAAKMAKQDGLLDFDQSAQCLHNKVRGFAGWPGTWAKITIAADGKDAVHQDLKILETKLLSQEDSQNLAEGTAANGNEIGLCSDGLLLPCGDGNTLLATSVQAPGKKACSAAAFGNGHNGKKLYLAAQ